MVRFPVWLSTEQGSKSAGLWVPLPTSAEALLLPGQDARRVDDADALQYLVRHLGADQPAGAHRHVTSLWSIHTLLCTIDTVIHIIMVYSYIIMY